jgi:hypothetical protein
MEISVGGSESLKMETEPAKLDLKMDPKMDQDPKMDPKMDQDPKMELIQEGKAKIFFASSSPDDVFYNPGKKNNEIQMFYFYSIWRLL